MALQSWWQVATPDEDIVKGRLDEAIFAADLGDVVSGKAPQDYKDTALFFRKTYLTNGLQSLLEAVLGRLAGDTGNSVIQLQTPFGGGKTHSLLALYHAVKNREAASYIPHLKPLVDAVPTSTGVACFVGTHADPLKGKTPWGEMAHQLGAYAVLKEHDKRRVAPGKQVLREVFQQSGPALVLMDELLEYVVRAEKAAESLGTDKGQVLAFLQELTEVAATTPQVALVLTLPASSFEWYGEEAEKAEKSLTQLQKISGRVEAIYTPVEGMEIYEIIRTRLFENLGEEAQRKEVAEYYFDLYQKLGNDVPAEVREVGYRQRIEKAYPFHPELIDVLYERWGSYPTFQRTRGALRLLALAVESLYKVKQTAPLIQSSMMDMGNAALRREFVKHIGNEFDTVIAADVAGKATDIDAAMGSEYQKYDIARGAATAVFLYSFSGAQRQGVSLPGLRVASLREGIPSTIVGDAVKKLKEELWYFHSEGNLYSFANQANLNRVILNREETVTDEMIETALRERLEKLAGSDFEVRLWPRNSGDVADTRRTKLAVLSPEYLYLGDGTNAFAGEMFKSAGQAFRAFKNALIVAAIDAGQWGVLKMALRRWLALQALMEDKTLLETLSTASRQELESKLSEAGARVSPGILMAYRHLALSSPEGVQWMDLGIAPTGVESLGQRIRDYLRDMERLLTGLSSRFILDRTFGREEQEKPYQSIYELFLKTPGMPLLKEPGVLATAVEEGVAHGLLGVRIGEDIYFREVLSDLAEDAVVLKPELAERLKAEKEGPPEEAPPVIDVEPGPVSISGLEAVGQQVPVKRLRIVAQVPWENLASIIGGVINPLKDKGTVNITLEIQAESEEGFDRTTLDSKVRETLQQIGAKFEWEEH